MMMDKPPSDTTKKRSFVSDLTGSALLGGAFGLFQVFLAKDQISPLPISTQLIFLGTTWYAAALVGFLSAVLCKPILIILSLVMKARFWGRLWPGWIALALCIWLEGYGGSPKGSSFWSGTLLTLAALLVILILPWLFSRLPLLHFASFWGLVNLAGLLGVSLRLLWTGPLSHGAQDSGGIYLLPAMILSGLPLLALWVRRRHRWAGPVVLLFFLLMGCAWFVAPGFWQPGIKSAVNKPNIVLISVDTLRADHLGCYGNQQIQTPHTDDLAREGVLFENAISPMPLTNPSHTSMLTGLYPGNHGVIKNRPLPFPWGNTLPELLSERGYKTAAFVSGYTLTRPLCSFNGRFQLYDDNFGLVQYLPDPCHENGFAPLLLRLVRAMNYSPITRVYEKRAGPLVDDVVPWLDRNAAWPFFLFVHFYDPHGPYEPPPPYNKLYDPEYKGRVSGNWYHLPTSLRDQIVRNPADLQHLKALYAGEVSYVDEHMGRLMETLERLHLTERTLIIFTSDHGESLTEHEYFFSHAEYLYDPSLKVPLIFSFPDGMGRGKVCRTPVQLVDIYPTVLDFLGIPMTEPTDGESLMALCRDGDTPGQARAAMSIATKSMISIRTEAYKYILTSPWWYDVILMPQQEELYDLATDAEETCNLLGQKKKAGDKFRVLAESFRKKWFSPKNGMRKPISDQDKEILKSLGYAQ